MGNSTGSKMAPGLLSRVRREPCLVSGRAGCAAVDVIRCKANAINWLAKCVCRYPCFNPVAATPFSAGNVKVVPPTPMPLKDGRYPMAIDGDKQRLRRITQV